MEQMERWSSASVSRKPHTLLKVRLTLSFAFYNYFIYSVLPICNSRSALGVDLKEREETVFVGLSSGTS